MQRHRHNPEQVQVLIEDLQTTANRLLTLNFSDPATDHQNIRHHAYLMGRLEYIKTLLEDKYPDPQPPSME